MARFPFSLDQLAPVWTLLIFIAHGAWASAQDDSGLPIELQAVLNDVSTVAFHDDGGRRLPEYWIGIDCQATERGVMVNRVAAEGPAALGGLLAGDLIVAVGDRDVRDPDQIAERLAGSQGRELRFIVLRDGKKVGLDIYPRRQMDERGAIVREQAGLPLKKSEPSQPEPHFRVVPVPPTLAPPGASGNPYTPAPVRPVMGPAHALAQLPDDMQVTIAKKGSSPAVVTCKQGHKLWKTIESELDMLPPPARAYATRALGKDVHMYVPHPGGGGMPPMGGLIPGPIAPQAEPKRIELRLDGGQFKIEGK